LRKKAIRLSGDLTPRQATILKEHRSGQLAYYKSNKLCFRKPTGRGYWSRPPPEKSAASREPGQSHRSGTIHPSEWTENPAEVAPAEACENLQVTHPEQDAYTTDTTLQNDCEGQIHHCQLVESREVRVQPTTLMESGESQYYSAMTDAEPEFQMNSKTRPIETQAPKRQKKQTQKFLTDWVKQTAPKSAKDNTKERTQKSTSTDTGEADENASRDTRTKETECDYIEECAERTMDHDQSEQERSATAFAGDSVWRGRLRHPEERATDSSSGSSSQT